jgi:hypothetical protein
VADGGYIVPKTGAGTKAAEICRIHESMEGYRRTWEPHWRQIADRLFINQADFQGQNSTPGMVRTNLMFDATAPLALTRYAAAIDSMATPRNEIWHSFRAGDPDLDYDDEVGRYLEECLRRIFRARYSPQANFTSQTNSCYMAHGAFGTTALFVDDVPGITLRYRAIPLSELFISEDHVGRIDTVHRAYKPTVRQICQQWPDTVPDEIKDKLDSDPDSRAGVIHRVCPNEDLVPGRLDWRGKPFYSCYVLRDKQHVLSEGGYFTMPYAVMRAEQTAREIYGRSPAMTVLPDIKMLNEMSKTVIQQAQRKGAPPLLLSDDGVLSSVSLQSNALNWGGIDEQGRPRVMPLDTGADLKTGLEMEEQRRKVINDAFLVTLFQILVDTPEMTATEAMLRAQEKGALLAPTAGRIQTEFLGPLIQRELEILSRAGVFPPMPEKLKAAGGFVKLEYTSPLARAQKAGQAAGILRMLEAMSPLAQVNPQAMRRINADQCLEVIAEANNVPLRCLYSDEELQAMDQAQAQQQQLANLVQAAPALAGAAKDLSQAQATAQNNPQPQQ